MPHESVKPIKLTMAPRLAQSRAEIVEQLYKDLGLNKSVHFVHSPPLHSVLFGLAWNCLSVRITLSVLSLVLPGTVYLLFGLA